MTTTATSPLPETVESAMSLLKRWSDEHAGDNAPAILNARREIEQFARSAALLRPETGLRFSRPPIE